MAAAANESKPSAGAAPSLKQTAIAVVVVSLLAGGLGAFLTTSGGSTDSPASAPAAEAAPHTETKELPPIVTNLADPPDMWIRLELSIVFDPKATPHAEALPAELANDIIDYLRTVTLAQIQGPSGMQTFRQSLNERAALRSNGAVSELVFRTLVIQ